MGAYVQGFEKLDGAVRGAMRDVVPKVPDDVQYTRYRRLLNNPVELFAFVQKGLNTKDPDRLQRGAREYLSEMQKRFGGE